jgi:hypothetical protein
MTWSEVAYSWPKRTIPCVPNPDWRSSEKQDITDWVLERTADADVAAVVKELERIAWWTSYEKGELGMEASKTLSYVHPRGVTAYRRTPRA